MKSQPKILVLQEFLENAFLRAILPCSLSDKQLEMEDEIVSLSLQARILKFEGRNMHGKDVHQRKQLIKLFIGLSIMEKTYTNGPTSLLNLALHEEPQKSRVGSIIHPSIRNLMKFFELAMG